MHCDNQVLCNYIFPGGWVIGSPRNKAKLSFSWSSIEAGLSLSIFEEKKQAMAEQGPTRVLSSKLGKVCFISCSVQADYHLK